MTPAGATNLTSLSRNCWKARAATCQCVCGTNHLTATEQSRRKRRFLAMARGSATETAAAIDVLRLRRLGPEAACANARHLALRVVQVLTKLDAALA